MKLTIKHGRLYDIRAKAFVEALADWFGHGDHQKYLVEKTKKVTFIPYMCECGAILSDLHVSSIFKDWNVNRITGLWAVSSEVCAICLPLEVK